MKVFVAACIIAAFCVTSSLQDTPFAPCVDAPSPKVLNVEGCTSSPCLLYKGTNLTAYWDFIAIADTDTLKPRVKVTIGGIAITYPYPQPDACKSLSKGECPLEKDDEVRYNLEMPISTMYPTVPLDIEFALMDENDQAQVCFKLACRVTNKGFFFFK